MRKSKGSRRRRAATAPERTAPPARAAAVAPARNRALWWDLAIIAVTLLAYIPALRAGFIWDDDEHVTANVTLRSLDGLRRIWFEPGATWQYYPLVHTS